MLWRSLRQIIQVRGLATGLPAARVMIPQAPRTMTHIAMATSTNTPRFTAISTTPTAAAMAAIHRVRVWNSKWLRASGCSGFGRIQTISYGKERPAVVGDDESAWSQNRRAVTVITNQ